MGNTIKGLTVEIGGDTTKLGKALEDVNAKSRSLTTDLKNVNNLLKFDPSSAVLLAQKEAILNQAIDNTRTKLNTLKEAQAQVQAQFDRGEITETQFNSLKNEITSTALKLQSYEKQLQSVTSVSGRMKSEITDQESALSDLKTRYTDVVLAQGKNSTAAKDLAKQINSLSGELKDNKSELQNAESSADEFDQSIEKAGDETKDAGEKAEKSGDGFTVLKGVIANVISDAVISGIKSLAKAAVGLATGLIGAATSAAEYADNVTTLATQTGLSTDTIQEMQYASELLDVDLETQTKGLAKVVKAIGSAVDAGNSYIEIADGVSVSIYDANGNLRDSEDVFYASIDALGSLTNETERETAAQELFGKSYQEIMPLIEAGSEGMEALALAAQDAGYVLSGDSLNALNAYKDSLDVLANQKTAFTNAVGAAMAPAMESFADSATMATAALTQLVNGSINAASVS